MEIYTLVAGILCLTAAFSVFNARVLRLPESIGLMLTALLASLAVLLFGWLFPHLVMSFCHRVAAFDFSSFVLNIALGFLIFAGAYGADSQAMSRERWPILLFATLGILISTFLVGGMAWLVLGWLKIEAAFLHCLLFGALISPTDPIAALSILKTTTVRDSLQADIAGESLLNDGVAVVVFLTLFQIAGGGAHGGGPHDAEFGIFQVIQLFAREVIGGVGLGLLTGWIVSWLARLTRIPSVNVLVSLAAVMGCYALSWQFQVSGPLALVVAGLILGRKMRSSADSEQCSNLDMFWESVDNIFNAVLFTLMGLVLLGLSEQFEPSYLLVSLLAVPIVLLARVIAVAAPLPLTKLRCGKPGETIAILVWGGLRGGISIALALSLQPEMSRPLILQMTYVVVLFSILVQGLTIGRLVKRMGVA